MRLRGSALQTDTPKSVCVAACGAGLTSTATLLPIKEDDALRVTDGVVMAGEREAARLAIHPEDGDVVAVLVATVEESARGVEVEAARVVPARSLLPDKRQLTFCAD
jgi:hypothetical protein